MTLPRHTPYTGPSKPFTIGLGPLEAKDWIEPEPALDTYLTEKRHLWETSRDLVFAAMPDTVATQQELLDSLAVHLCEHQPQTYVRRGQHLSAGSHIVDLADDSIPPLVRAGFLVADDLVIMRKLETGWTLVAAHLSFPSSWSLAEKFGHTMDEIHGPVPGFQAGTRNASLITRMFDNLHTPVWRMNWSLNPNARLFLPKPKVGHSETLQEPYAPERIFVRVERQSLVKLPVSRDIVFTIKIHVDPLTALAAHPEATRLGEALAGQLAELDTEQMTYKGVIHNHQSLVDVFRNIGKNA